jgi:hypothetical protein
MRRYVIDPPFADNPDFAPVTQAFSILRTGSNDCPPPLSRGGLWLRGMSQTPMPIAITLPYGAPHPFTKGTAGVMRREDTCPPVCPEPQVLHRPQSCLVASCAPATNA